MAARLNVVCFPYGDRAIKELHRQAADRLAADHATRAEVERLLSELQQLLAGISIMQVGVASAAETR